MAEIYSSLFKGKVHVTTPYSDSHKALDMGNYKTKNKIYSPTKFGAGTVTKYTKSYTYNKILYKDAATIWYSYPNGWVMCLVHGDVKDQIVKVGDKIKVGQQIYVTGNKGYSFGDHLHCQLTKYGVYKDPANHILNDKPVAVPPVVPPVITPTPDPVPEPPTAPPVNDTPTSIPTTPPAEDPLLEKPIEHKTFLQELIQFFTDLLQSIFKSD